MTDITVSRELLRHVLDSCEPEANNEQQMLAYDALRAALEQQAVEPDNLQCKTVQKRLATQWGYVEAQPSKAVKLTTDEYTALAHRIASKYTHRSDPAFTGYTFLPHTLEQFVDAVQAALWAKFGVTE